ncbi:hypothetical protein JTB14_035201 [Gonioctena quinquepunctata]|nr:hypothetical protein JTB14_035201 [Gonioctena quinquepunctata]
MSNKCMVLFCKNRGNIPGLTYFGLSKERHDSWLLALGRDPTIEHLCTRNRVCSEHFLERDFIISQNRVKLKEGAIPILKLGIRKVPFQFQLNELDLTLDEFYERMSGNFEGNSDYETKESNQTKKPVVKQRSISTKLREKIAMRIQRQKLQKEVTEERKLRRTRRIRLLTTDPRLILKKTFMCTYGSKIDTIKVEVTENDQME